MDKLKMQTENIVDENVAFIEQRFPNAIVEAKDKNGKVSKMVDFDLLKQELTNCIIDSEQERYTFNWPGKKDSILLSNSSISKTLRPCKEKSIDFDNTKNIYIEGDNLDVLKLLRETYLNKIKVIYIDPPYNTGKDSFVYDDKRILTEEKNKELSGVYDENKNILFDIRVNNESNGQFHSDWLTMIYPRIKVSKDLLTDDGFLFISIDENEFFALKRICNEIFGESNCVGEFIWKNRTTPNDADNMFAMTHEYILIYAKDIKQVSFVGIKKDLSNYLNPDNDPNGCWIKDNPSAASGSSKDRFAIINPYTKEEYYPPRGRYWAFSEKRVEEWTKTGKLVFPKELGKNFILKKYLTELKSNYQPIPSIIDNILTMHGTKEMKELFPDGDRVFKYPKPTELLKYIISQVPGDDYICLDYFSGSSSTAHSIIKLNAEDGGNRKFIMVQLPEKPNDEIIINMGYHTICDIAEERIRRAGKKIKEENPMMAQKLDTGFRVFKLDSSNMKDTYYKPSEYSFNLLDSLDENIKPDRTPEDLLFQVMLDLGLMLDSKIEEKNINGKKVFIVGEYNEMINPDLICCFDSNVDNSTVTEIAKMQPRFAVFRDSSMAKDSVAVNFDQIFETYSPTTTRKVL